MCLLLFTTIYEQLLLNLESSGGLERQCDISAFLASPQFLLYAHSFPAASAGRLEGEFLQLVPCRRAVIVGVLSRPVTPASPSKQSFLQAAVDLLIAPLCR